MTATYDPPAALLRPVPATTQKALTLSLIYADDAWDWMQATDLELTVEAGYLRAWLAREDSAAAREELKRVLAAAQEKGLGLK